MARWAALLVEAERLGLTVAGSEAAGVLGGRRLTLTRTLGDAQGQRFSVRGYLDPPLDLGLSMREIVTASILARAPMTGHPDLDAEFTVEGDEPGRVRQLFNGPLRDELAALY